MRRISTALVAAALLGCGPTADVTPPRTAALAARAPAPMHYELRALATLGGTSRGNAIDDRGWVAGYSAATGQPRHAALWRGDGSLLDLGTLGGPQSTVPWPGLDERGTVVGISETADVDPLGEAWSCSAFFPRATGNVCRGFAWRSGRMTAMPTFGGHNSFATGVNARGQVVGWAETPVHDPTCRAPQVLQFRAAVWEPRRGTLRQLAPLPGDSTSAATAINARGQVVGISGACGVAVGEFSAAHAVLWDRGVVRDLGSLGGVAWNTPMAINDAGDVVGFSDLPGDADGTSNSHAFLWTRGGGMRDLGTLPGDQTSQANGINARRQVVGSSCGPTVCRAFLWQNGVMTELAALIPSLGTDQLPTAQDINDAGVITGRVAQAATGLNLAFVATPVGR